jgi:peroxiredoxin family protein
MTPDQITQTQLNIALLQLIITSLAIFLGPLAGVFFTFWFQARKDKNKQKHNLFLILMSERKGLQMSPQMSQALNTIDIVYSDTPQVVNLWHKYYSLLAQPPSEERAHTWLELLTTMAESLKYPNIKQTDLDKFYIPQGHADDIEFQRKVSHQWSRVLENTERLLVEPIKGSKTKLD